MKNENKRKQTHCKAKIEESLVKVDAFIDGFDFLVCFLVR